jgi:hypothetical protein
MVNQIKLHFDNKSNERKRKNQIAIFLDDLKQTKTLGQNLKYEKRRSRSGR